MIESRGKSSRISAVANRSTAAPCRFDRRQVRSSVLALLLASAATGASPGGAVTYALMGTAVSRVNFTDPTTMTLADFVENGTFGITIGGGSLTYNGILRDGAGTFSLTKLGDGNLTLTGANTYSGETHITLGSLIAGADNSFSANSRVRIGMTLELAGFDQIVRGFYQSGFIRNTSGGTATLTTNPLVASSFSGSIVETAGNEIALVKTGAGQQDLIGVNTYSGGTLGFGNSSAIGTGALTVSAAGSVLQALGPGLTLGNAIVLDDDVTINGAGLSPTLTGVISGTGALNKIGSGALTITNGANTYSGGTSLAGGSLLLGGDNVLGDITKALVVGPASSLGTMGISALLSNDIVANAQITLLAPGNAALDIAGVISGAGNVVVSGTTGTVILRSANTYAGTTTLQGGVLVVANNLALGGLDKSLSITAAGTLRALDNLVITSNLRLGANLTVDTAGFDVTLADTINNSTAVLTGGLIKTGLGTLTLGSSNNYSDGTVLRGGVLSVADNNRLGNVIGGLTFDGGSLRITGVAFSTTGRLVTLLSSGTIDIVDAANIFILSDPIDGAGGITKQARARWRSARRTFSWAA